MADQKRLEALADEHLALMTADWQACAESIRLRYPRPAGETNCFEEAGSWCELSDSLSWVAEPDGDILLLIEAYDAAGNSAVRKKLILHPGR